MSTTVNNMPSCIDDAIRLLSRIDRCAAAALKKSLASVDRFVLKEKIVHHDVCSLKRNPTAYASYQVQRMRRSIVGRYAPLLYGEYLKGQAGLLDDVMVDVLNGHAVARLADEILFPSAMAAVGTDVVAMRKAFNESLYRYFMDEAVISWDAGICLPSIEHAGVTTWVYIFRRTDRKPRSKRWKHVLKPRREPPKPKVPKPHKKVAKVHKVRRRIKRISIGQLMRVKITLPNASSDPHAFRCRRVGAKTECYYGTLKLSKEQICRYYRGRIPTGSNITCKERMPNMTAVSRAYAARIPSQEERARQKHHELMRRSVVYRTINTVIRIKNINTRRAIQWIYDLENITRRR